MSVLIDEQIEWDVDAFLQRLTEVGYTHSAIQKLPPPLAHAGSPDDWRAAACILSRQRDPLITALRLFQLGDAVPLDAAMDLLGWLIRDLQDAGLLQTAAAGMVEATVQILPGSDEWIAADFPIRQSRHSDQWVMGVGPSSRQLLSLAPRLTSGRVLEAGCGIGWIARQFEKMGLETVGTDINPRAIALARLNAKLNGTGESVYREGDFFTAAAREAPFDLILANPPYVLSPGGGRIYCESPDGVPLCQRVVAEAGAYLAPGGFAILLLNWAHETDNDWANVPLSWLGTSDQQVWLHQTESLTPAHYAWNWLKHDFRFTSVDPLHAEYQRWLDHYQAVGVKRISVGFMVVRKPLPGEPAWTRTDARQIHQIRTDAGLDVVTIMANEMWLRQHQPTPDRLLDQLFTPCYPLRATVAMELAEQQWTRRRIDLSSAGQLGYSGQVDETLLRLLEIASQGKPPRVLVTQMQEKAGAERARELESQIAGLTRELLRYGLVGNPVTG